MSAFENLRVNPFSSDRSKTVAFVSCKINTEAGALYLNNMTLVNGSNGLFLSYPSRKLPKPDAKGNEYQNHYFMDRTLRDSIQEAAINEYNMKAGSGSQGGGYGGGGGGGYGQQQQGGGGYGGGQQGGGSFAGNTQQGGYGGGQQGGGGRPVTGAEDDIPF